MPSMKKSGMVLATKLYAILFRLFFFDYNSLLDAKTSGFAGLPILQEHRSTTIRIPALARGPTLRSGRSGRAKT